ncbi:MuF-like minor capsid protein [Mycobacterium phage PhelpsODU]|uniref:MuF-like minor capsid protein n=1 Tax=Mycobacterium phage Unicorn TaxID=2015825 RepID=A0A222ZLG9_9CAUD|nr:head maturation protease [Mycobacterium phage Unicorn]ASR85021.1 MuF-like minor capsid protein [Mycobacterium phage Unicorn]ASR85121.1 MuF-like minor capsid protein [Mycobacterium phage PhelpsODU]
MTTAVPEFQGVLNELAGRVGRAVDTFVPRLAEATRREGLALITDAYPALADPFLAAAADLSTQWYAEQPGGAEAFTPEPAALPDPSQLAANGRWALLQSDPLRALRGTATRAVFDSSRRTVLGNAEREGSRWVRHASANACGYCRMLATRVLTMDQRTAPGLYRSEASATQAPHRRDAKGHDHCKCLVVPLRENGVDYATPAYVHDWLADYEAVSRDADGVLLSPNVIARAMESRGNERTRLHRVGQWLDAEDEHRHAVAYYERADQEIAKLLGLPEPEPAPAAKAKRTRKPKRTLDEIEAELSAAIEVGDEDLQNRLIDEMERVEARENAAAAKASAKAAEKEAATRAKWDRMGELMDQGYDEVEAEAEAFGLDYEFIVRRNFMRDARADGHTGKSFEELLYWVFQERVTEQYWAAEEATNGVMLKKKYGAGSRHIDPRKLWSVNETTARKWMSEEMAQWFDENGRVTKAELREAILNGRSWKQNALVGYFNA